MAYISTIAVAFLAIITTSVSVALAAEIDDAFSGVTVFTRESKAHSFSLSHDASTRVKHELRSGARSWSADVLSTPVLGRRLLQGSAIALTTCNQEDCSQCTNYFVNFADNFCLEVPGTNCIIIKTLQDAHIHYWAHGKCNGPMTGYYGCGTTKTLDAPGTESIGFQNGC